jgi:hypothetical protein
MIGTLLAIEGVDVSSQLGGQVIAYFESGNDVPKGAKLVQLTPRSRKRTSPTRRRCRPIWFRAPIQAGEDRRGLLVRRDDCRRQTAVASVAKMDAIIAEKNIIAPFAGSVPPGREGNM